MKKNPKKVMESFFKSYIKSMLFMGFYLGIMKYFLCYVTKTTGKLNFLDANITSSLASLALFF